jgi:miniconductance mechanosensitive channel
MNSILAHLPELDLPKATSLLISMGCAWLLTRLIFVVTIPRWIKKSKTTWDDILLQYGVLPKFQLLVLGILFWRMVPTHWPLNVGQSLIQLVALTAMYWMVARFIRSLLNTSYEAYLRLDISRDKPIGSYVQLCKLLVWLVTILFIVSAIFKQDPTRLLTGLGALTAVIMLIFKDTILGLVASVQLTSNHMVRRGDWIEMPKYHADGDVMEVNLHTVKVRNWDKTITTIPTWALVNDSFKNWRGMSESGGRRIKRSILIDISTIRFLDETLLTQLKSIVILKDYLNQKQAEISADAQQRGYQPNDRGNGRHLTNIGTFREYTRLYLNQREDLHKNMTFLVRHRDPSPQGLPLEIYVFTTTTSWVNYEGIQADIFDHLLAMLEIFKLRAFQEPTGHDILHRGSRAIES